MQMNLVENCFLFMLFEESTNILVVLEVPGLQFGTRFLNTISSFEWRDTQLRPK